MAVVVNPRQEQLLAELVLHLVATTQVKTEKGGELTEGVTLKRVQDFFRDKGIRVAQTYYTADEDAHSFEGLLERFGFTISQGFTYRSTRNPDFSAGFTAPARIVTL